MLVEMNEGGGTEGYQPGAMVKLRSGGPRMEVEGVRENGFLDCVWVDKGHEVHRDAFAPEMLKSAAKIWGT